jgi:hypothetical protein
MLDAFTVQVVAVEARKENGATITFQGIRAWGSFGFMLPALLLIPISQFTRVTSTTLVWVSAAFGAIAAVCALFLPHNEPLRGAPGVPSKEAIALAIKPPLRAVFEATTIASIALSMFYMAFPRFLQELGNSTTAIGLIINIGVAWEIAMMPFTSKLIARFGVKNVVMMGIISIPLRMVTVAVWPSTPLVIVLQVLHAPLVIGLAICMPIYLGQVAEARYRFSLQSINTTLFMGVSRVVGPILAAVLLRGYESDPMQGLRVLLLASGVLALCAAAALWRSGRNPEHPKEESPS